MSPLFSCYHAALSKSRKTVRTLSAMNAVILVSSLTGVLDWLIRELDIPYATIPTGPVFVTPNTNASRLLG